MKNKTKHIFVFADWITIQHEPQFIGTITVNEGKGKQLFSFEYDATFLKTTKSFLLDPEISWYAGEQFPIGKNCFGIFNDSMPDTWGRTLMKRRALINGSKEERFLSEVDFLLGVHDFGRMGGLRFKLDKEGGFLDDDSTFPTPPWSSIREVQNGIRLIESKKENIEINNWLKILLAPGSSLGGARPKANILDENQQLWIAKFPSKLDEVDKGLWEYLAYMLAIKSGIQMSECKIQKVAGEHHTFFTKRFDRKADKRLHFASAMTITGNNESTLKDKEASYLDIAEFIQFNLSDSKTELHQLWRRILFSILISNTDDHLRNHGFLWMDDTWKLSPAYDINPSIDKNGLSLNIDMYDNSLSIDLLVSVAPYFQLQEKECKIIVNEVREVVSQWESEAKNIGISRAEISLMRPAFRVS